MKNQLERIAGALETIASELGDIKTRLAHLAMAMTPRPPPPPPLRNDAEDYVVPDIDRPKKTRRKKA